ncbi:MAG: sigma-70 family RNA polymerase sigma factor [Acidobacteria bacterium]|nr:sigma-70 family RNA polymerase sigma factor [Acidobacteriota bacterium]
MPSQADDHLLEVYSELRRLARLYLRGAANGATLQPTALVHEAYLHLSGNQQFANRTHFLGVAAVAMRQVLARHRRDRSAIKRGGLTLRVSLGEEVEQADASVQDFDDLERALDRLEAEAPELSRIVELRFFGGLSVEESAEFLGISPATVKRRWFMARAWLQREMEPPATPTQE